ncbi:MAG: hypothetical protein JXR41_06380 [Bacteroidales bacterium]|nr:hypothetical protein [Bacteroidales bacterium]MBN2762697.1 hypothetical protein [Bacteroidales bacterium]
MKRTAIICMIMLSLLTLRAFSQEISYEIKVSYNENQIPLTADIKINVTKGTPFYTFYLMTNDPVHGEILRESGPVEKRSFTFDAVQTGKYFIKIVDRNGMSAGKTVDIASGNN